MTGFRRVLFRSAPLLAALPRDDRFGVGLLLGAVVGLWPFESVLNAEFMANEVPGMIVPAEVIDRMRRAEEAGGAAEEGVAIARELGCALKGLVQGVRVAAPSGRIEAALEVVAGFK